MLVDGQIRRRFLAEVGFVCRIFQVVAGHPVVLAAGRHIFQELAKDVAMQLDAACP